MRKINAAVMLLMALSLASASVAAENQITSLVFFGLVNSYGEQYAWGWLHGCSKVGEWAKVTAIFHPEQSMPGSPLTPGLNESYSFYLVRLTPNKTAIAELNYSDGIITYDFYTEGLWDIYNVTFTYFEDNCTKEILTVSENVTGKFYIFDGWTMFEIQIEGMDPITGNIVGYIICNVALPEGEEEGVADVNLDGSVNVLDLIKVGRACGTAPGLIGYSLQLDVNQDLEVNVLDLIAVATNLGMELEINL